MKRFHTRSLGIVVAVALALPVSSAGAAQDRNAEAVDSETRTFALGPNALLELENVSGDIECVVSAGPDVVVRIDRVSRGRSDSSARMGLREVRTLVDAQVDRASLRVQYPPDRRSPPYSVSVSYAVSAPAGTRLKIASVSGDIRVRGIAGGLSATSVSGDVEVTDAGPVSRAASVSGDVTVTGGATDDGVEVESVSGDVTVTGLKAGRLTAKSVSGDIEVTNVTTADLGLSSTAGNVTFDGDVVKHGHYELRSHSGDVRITTAAAGGYELRATTFSGRIQRAGTGGASDGQSAKTVRTTVGDGSAVIEATSFSGDVVVTTR
jgi:DUF4097 and DUF4098 domain-containing protein YvlB